MEKALWFQFTVGLLPMFAVTFMGYWAYGSATSSYLLNNVTGPAWIKMIANASAFLQTVIALHVRFLLFYCDYIHQFIKYQQRKWKLKFFFFKDQSFFY